MKKISMWKVRRARRLVREWIGARWFAFQIVDKQMAHVWTHLRAMVRDLIELPRGLPRACEYIAVNGGGRRIGMPMDIPTLRHAREVFRAHGWEVTDYSIDDSLLRWYSATASKKGKLTVDLAGMQYREGSTCKIAKIGTEIKEVDVLEVRCDDERVTV